MLGSRTEGPTGCRENPRLGSKPPCAIAHLFSPRECISTKRRTYRLTERRKRVVIPPTPLYGSYRKSRLQKKPEACSWAAGISNSFQADPESCPDCGGTMRRSLVFSFQARQLERSLRCQYTFNEGYFRPIRPP